MRQLITFFATLAFLFPASIYAQDDNWENQIRSGEKKFEKGNYKQVVSQFEKLIRKQDKSGIIQNSYPLYLAILAQAKEATGHAMEADTLLSKGYDLWKQKSSGHLDHLRLHGDLVFAKSYQTQQNNKRTMEFIQDARSVITPANDPKGYWKNEFDILEFIVLESNMDYNHALVLKDSILDYQRYVTTRKQKVFNEKKQIFVNKNIPKKEYKKRADRMAFVKVMEADIYRKKGHYSKADSLYNLNKKSLLLYVKRNNINVTRNTVGLALLERDMGEFNKSAKHLRKARNKFSNRVKYSFPNLYYFEIFKEEILSDLLAGDYSKYRSAAKQYRREAINSYGKKSTHYLQSRSLLIEDDFLRGKYNRAFKKSEKLIGELDTFYPENHLGRERFLYQQYDISVRRNDFSYARQLSDDHLDLVAYNKGIETSAYQRALLDRAYFETEYTNDFKIADTLYNINFDPLVRKQYHQQHIDYLYYLNSYGKMYESTDRFDQAMEIYQEGAKNTIDVNGENSVEYGLQLEKIAGIQIIKGDYLLAEETLEKAVTAIEVDKAKISLAYVSALQTLASLYNINGKFELAQSTLKKAYRISKRLGDDNENLQVNSVQDLANVYIKTGRYDDAEQILTKTLEIKRNKFGEEHFQLIDTYSQLGELYLIKGDFIAAEKATRNALDITEVTVGDTSIKYLDNLVLLADVYANMGDNTKATNLYNEAIRRTTDIFSTDHIKIADVMVKKSKVMINGDNTSEDIIGTLDKAASIIELNINNQHPKYAETLELKARVLVREKKYEEALVLLEKANTIYESTFGENHIKTADNRVLVANLYYRKNDFDKAIAYYEKAMSTYKHIFNKDHPKYVMTHSKLGQSYYAKKDYKNATQIFNSTTETYLSYIHQYFPSLSENEKAKYWNTIRGDFEIYNSLALNTYEDNPDVLDGMYNNNLSTKAILLSSSIKIKERILKYGDPQLIARYEEWVRKREMLTKAISMSAEEQKLSNINRSKLQKEILLLEKELSESSEGFAQNFEKKKVDWKDVKSTLKEGEAAIELIRFNYFTAHFTDSVIYAALIIKPDSKHPDLVVLDKGNDLEGKYYKYYRNGIKYKAKDKYSYKLYWSKIDEKLAGVNNVYLSVDGVYNQLNPETFRMKDGTYLIEKYTFYNVSNTKDLVLNERSDKIDYKTHTATLFGNPKFKEKTQDENASASRSGNKVSSVAPLPGAEKEVKELSAFLSDQEWKTETFLLGDATEAKVKDMESPRIFHVATHGFFMQEDASNSDNLDNEKPVDNPLLKAGLLFVGADELLSENNIYQFNRKDGILTAYEAMNLNLDNTELVVLSACETGLGEVRSGEGVYGLQRSFLVAGAQNIIMTLFKVNDQVTQELMNDFYKRWFETGNKRQAFLDAKKTIKEKYESPIFWGSFVLVGLD